MRNKKYFIPIMIMIVALEIFSVVFVWNITSDKETILDDVKLRDKELKGLAIMLEKENDDGTYSYIESDTNSWPDDLVINYDKSGCIDTNGQIIEDSLYYDVETKIATVETGVTTKCYLYFDIDKTFAIYSETDNSLRFYNNNDYKTIEEKETYNDLAVTSVYKNFINETYTYDSETDKVSTPWFEKNEEIVSVYIVDEIKPNNIQSWFNNLKNISNMNLEKLNVSQVTNMGLTFWNTGYNSSNFAISGLSTWDVSNVKIMWAMFADAGYSSTNWSIGDLSNWNVSNVINMESLFGGACISAQNCTLGNLDNWNVSKVVNMMGMFRCFGQNATKWNIGDISSWNVSRVQRMNAMFIMAGQRVSEFNIGKLNNWDVSNVVTINSMFSHTGFYSLTFNIGDLSKWNTSKVIDMYGFIMNAGYNSTWSMDLSKWNVSKVTSYGQFSSNSNLTQPIWVNVSTT